MCPGKEAINYRSFGSSSNDLLGKGYDVQSTMDLLLDRGRGFQNVKEIKFFINN
ncbi:MAG: hypothetical protein GY828_00150 [Candidatus Gracilibacteria bacterium]|nr:hypothetical protein [Candidatus Gracilibacteria bacterium]